ncbi:exodeoxyribonuclease VII large subunit [Balneicella halophila]|uniref:Exodeoxyribonuclease 7 large subunit n=1 Tax=Balneicella halophila TaxID=1537566 RepID=A0A7L4UMJ0_BALHA|nr:exodeoxyribonuclease VII large subunit [Balneicella halophila]PVX49836.1 exodeoxyribonuclease VII large subunit [Balneicella halophila]
MANNSISLLELNQKIKQGIEGLFPFPVWVVAEISELNVRNHCYLELVERDESTDRIVAKSRAMIWSYTYNLLKPYFETSTGYELSAGLKVMVQVEVQHSELYGLSLSIKDIDPNYTLGDMQRRKQQIIQQLKDEGILEMNKSLEFPLVPKNIAVVSSEKAAGYQDFIEQLTSNDSGFKFHIQLFPAMMQGEQARFTIMQALENIYCYEEVFDVVVIIRGGGAVSDLSCFDDYELAAHVAQFPLPILTGIGHDKDVSIVDEVAHLALKTPTAVAAYLVNSFESRELEIFSMIESFAVAINNHLDEQQDLISGYYNSLKYTLPSLLKETKQELATIAKDLNYILQDKLSFAINRQEHLKQKLQYALKHQKVKECEQIAYLERKLVHRTQQYLTKKEDDINHKMQLMELVSPQKILERGYSITIFDGKVVKDATKLTKDDEITTQLAKGKIKATIK